MKTWLLLLGCLLAFASSAQSSRREVWQWKDANGVTHFSDYPAPGARKIVLNGSPASTTAEPCLRRGCCQTTGTARCDRSRLRTARDLVAGEWRQLLRRRRRRQRPHSRRARTGAHGSPAHVSRRQAAAGRKRAGTFAEQRGTRRAFGDERDRQPRRQGTDPQRARRLSRAATEHQQSAQPGSGRPAAAARAGG